MTGSEPRLRTDRPMGHETAGPGRKPYRTPQIVHEAEMEARAGSPLFGTDPVSGDTQNPWDPAATGSQH